MELVVEIAAHMAGTWNETHLLDQGHRSGQNLGAVRRAKVDVMSDEDDIVGAERCRGHGDENNLVCRVRGSRPERLTFSWVVKPKSMERLI